MTRRQPRLQSKIYPDGQAPPKLPPWQGLMTSLVAHTFVQLRVSVSLWMEGDFWYPIHIAPNPGDFEYEVGAAPQRWAYNFRSFSEVRRQKRIVRGKHAGFYDLFVPLIERGEVSGILVAGPFATETPTSAVLLERWHTLTGSHGRLTDPAFPEYVTRTLATLTLEGARARSFERLMACFADLVVGFGDVHALAEEAENLRVDLEETRFADRSSEAVRNMIDERTNRAWPLHGRTTLARLGMQEVPEHVVVGLALGRLEESDPVDERLRRDAFQRACVELARKLGYAISGKVGDHGVVFLVDDRGSRPRLRTKLADLATRAATLARRHRLRLFVGISQATQATSLPARYQGALWAAEKALSKGVAVEWSEHRPAQSADQLRELRAELAKSIAGRPKVLSPRFDRYIEAVLSYSGYRMDPTRAQLEAGLERIAELLLTLGYLDKKSFSELYETMEQSAGNASTVAELVASYRRIVANIESALRRPTLARQERSTQRAQSFMREHLGEDLTLAQVARIAGFAPDYFSRLLKRDEGSTFERYLQKLRVERAQQMLASSALSVEGVRTLTGFHTRNYFHRVFKKSVGMTPVEYRAASH